MSDRGGQLLTFFRDALKKVGEGGDEFVDPLALELGDDVLVIDTGDVQLVEQILRLRVTLEPQRNAAAGADIEL